MSASKWGADTNYTEWVRYNRDTTICKLSIGSLMCSMNDGSYCTLVPQGVPPKHNGNNKKLWFKSKSTSNNIMWRVRACLARCLTITTWHLRPLAVEKNRNQGVSCKVSDDYQSLAVENIRLRWVGRIWNQKLSLNLKIRTTKQISTNLTSKL